MGDATIEPRQPKRFKDLRWSQRSPRKLISPYVGSIAGSLLAIAVVAGVSYTDALERRFEITVAAVVAVGMCGGALLRARDRRAVGYYWVFPVSGMSVMGAAVAADGRHPWLAAALCVMIASGAVVHMAFRHVTGAWLLAVTLSIAALIAGLLSVDYGHDVVLWTFALAAPVLLVPVIAHNAGRRSAIVAMITAPMATLTILAVLGVRAGGGPRGKPCFDCDNPQMLDLVRYGWTAYVADVFDLVGPAVHPDVPLTDLGVAVAASLYAYGCYLLLRVNKARLRNVVEVHYLDESGQEITTPAFSFQAALLRGRVSIGASATDAEDAEVARSLLSIINAGNAVAGVGVKLLYSPSVRATLTYGHEPADPGGRGGRRADDLEPAISLLIEDLLSGSAVAVGALRRSDLLPGAGLEQIAAYQVLAYCLGGRGHPEWATWNSNGIGLGAWFEARRLRSERLQSVSAAQAAPSLLEGEIAMLTTALSSYDPRSLLLMLELGSRYDEDRNYVAAACVYLRAVSDYPQFPEAWLRLALAYANIAESLSKGVVPGVEPAGYDLFEHQSFVVGLRTPQYRRFASTREFLVFQKKVGSNNSVAQLGWGLREALDAVRGDVGRTDPHRVHDIDSLRIHFALVGAACARQCERRLHRIRITARCAFIQSERRFWWRLLFSRFAIRRLSSAARAAEVVAVRQMDGTEGLQKGLSRGARRLVRGTVGPTFAAVIRDGTGWRAPLLLARFYRGLMATLEPEDSKFELGGWRRRSLNHADASERYGDLRTLAERRARAERAHAATWLLEALDDSTVQVRVESSPRTAVALHRLRSRVADWLTRRAASIAPDGPA